MDQRDLDLRQLRKQRGRLQGDETAADDHDLPFRFRDLAQRLHVPQRTQVKNIPEIRPGHLRLPRPAARGQQRFAKFHGLPVTQHHAQTPLDIELREERIQPQVDVMLLKPRRVMDAQFFRRMVSALAQQRTEKAADARRDARSSLPTSMIVPFLSCSPDAFTGTNSPGRRVPRRAIR